MVLPAPVARDLETVLEHQSPVVSSALVGYAGLLARGLPRRAAAATILAGYGAEQDMVLAEVQACFAELYALAGVRTLDEFEQLALELAATFGWPRQQTADLPPNT